MRRSTLLLPLLLGCAAGLGTEDKPGNGTFDDGSPPTGPDSGGTADETCNGVDDDGDGEVDEGFADADADGVADCVDTATCPDLDVAAQASVTQEGACSAPPVADPWSVRQKWAFPGPASDPGLAWGVTAPLISYLVDDNQDGSIGDGDRAQIVLEMYNNGSRGHVVAVDAATGGETWDYWPVSLTFMVAIADVDVDGAPEVIAVDADLHPIALDGSGNLEWTATEPVSDPCYVGVAVGDLDADGQPEIVIGDMVLDGTTGALIRRLDIVFECTRLYEPVLVDLDLNGDLEILYGNMAFDTDGRLLWTLPEVDFEYTYWVRAVQADADPEPELFWGALQSAEAPFLTDHEGNTLSARGRVGDAFAWPCIGDFDGDGAVALATPDPSNGVSAFELDLSQAWANTSYDEFENAGCSAFDLDGDGGMEVLHAAWDGLAILDGRTGAALWHGDGFHASMDNGLYPTVADVDGDGHAEVFTVTSLAAWGPLAAWEHDGDGWSGAGATWPVFHYTENNIGLDGSVPTSPDLWWLGNGNVSSRVASPRPDTSDLRVSITDYCTADCPAGPVQVAVQVANHGVAAAPAGVLVSLYTNDEVPRLLATAVLDEVPAGVALDGVVLEFSLAEVSTQGVRVVVDDDGTGAGVVRECDETNNAATWTEVDCY